MPWQNPGSQTPRATVLRFAGNAAQEVNDARATPGHDSDPRVGTPGRSAAAGRPGKPADDGAAPPAGVSGRPVGVKSARRSSRPGRAASSSHFSRMWRTAAGEDPGGAPGSGRRKVILGEAVPNISPASPPVSQSRWEGQAPGDGEKLFGLFCAAGRTHGGTEAKALFLEPIEQTPGPDKFYRQHRKPEPDGQPAGTWRDQHDPSHQKQREADQDLEKPFGLVNRSEEHSSTPGPRQLSKARHAGRAP